jgi:hypothetical protein
MKKLENSKFETLLEYSLGRYQLGGYLLGDIVRIKSTALSHPYLASRGQTFKDMVKSLIDNNKDLRVSSIKSIRPDVSGIPHRSAPDGYYIDVFEEHAPGLAYNIMTLPSEVLELVDYGINLPPTGGIKKSNRVEKLHAEKPADLGTYPSDSSLPSNNTKLPSSNSWPNQPGGRKPQKY